ncbi:MAG: NHLP family bacteriocin export ABC transporter peptidase/permease/ATPase subunit [Candidatus Sericytochromatia bacterium]|nr:NHLP family bacteriocin export ABC transporter peptidase/permease/ATPase subunit [Candidatus Tanganyikabacteria bacterium]
MEAVECGAASLAMILAYYGRWVTLPELRQECGVSRDGSKASNIVKAARRFGLEAKGLKKELDAALAMAPPFIVFWNFNHFLVVEGFDKVRNRVFLNDPADGPRQVTLDEFDQAFSGVVLVFKPTGEFKKGGSKPDALAGLRSRLADSRQGLAYCLIAGAILLIPNISLPLMFQVFVDNVLVRGMTGWLEPLLLAMALLAAFKGLLRYLQKLALRRLNLKLSIGMTGRFIWHVFSLPVNFFSQRYLGDIVSRIRLNDRIADTLSQEVAGALLDVLAAVVFLALLLSYDVTLTLVCVAFASLNFLFMRISTSNGTDATKLSMEQGKAAGVAVGGLQAIETLKAAGLENDFFCRWSGYYTRAVNTQQRLSLRSELVGLVPPTIDMIITTTILILGGLKVLEGQLTIGMLVAFQGLVGSFLGPINRLVALGPRLVEIGGSVERLDDVLAHPLDPESLRPLEGKLEAGDIVRLKGFVELQKVSFGYSPLDPPLIDDLDIVLKPGQRVALVGGSGSGKSTVAKLISGLYQPWSGEIRFDGMPRTAIPRRVLANSLAVVEQDLFLFRGTIRENLTMWDDSVTEAELVAACQDANVHDIVMALPGGYDARLQEGASNLSGGQRQRLEIARALLLRPSILVLDEATSALDTESERIVDDNIRRRGCTCVIVAHRLSTVRDCDEIIVFDRGRVVQRGSHESLSAVEGHYRNLVVAESATRPSPAGSVRQPHGVEA